VLKLLVGLLKGAVIGGGISYGAYRAGFDVPWITYGVVGALVGLVAGRPIWSLIRDKNATSVVAMLRAAFGFGVGCGLFALENKAWSPSPLLVSGVDVFSWPLGIGIGAIWGAFVELDDAIGSDAATGKSQGDEKASVVAKPKQLKK
jgi:hypothetical protein